MGSGETGDGKILKCSSSVMATDTMPENLARIPNGVYPSYSCGWDPVVSVNQSKSFLGSSSMVPHNDQHCNLHFPVVLENQSQTMGPTSRGLHLADMMPKIASFRSESFSEMMSSFHHIDDYRLSRHQITPQNLTGATYITESHENSQKMEDGGFGTSPISKRKRKTAEAEPQGDSTMDIFESHKEDDEKKSFDPNSSCKQAVKQAKDNFVDAENSKENYVHMRAKRGQATNSHSLAERVRREKISERMKLLQELVPGCNKITGKAVMLDEIINYVQSLQQQVEFLSMKLATVNPELNVDIERILSKEILHQQGNNASAPGIGPGLILPHSLQGFQEGTMNGFPGTYPPLHQLSPSLWNSELQNILRMGLDSNHSVNSLGSNGDHLNPLQFSL